MPALSPTKLVIWIFRMKLSISDHCCIASWSKAAYMKPNQSLTFDSLMKWNSWPKIVARELKYNWFETILNSILQYIYIFLSPMHICRYSKSVQTLWSKLYHLLIKFSSFIDFRKVLMKFIDAFKCDSTNNFISCELVDTGTKSTFVIVLS